MPRLDPLAAFLPSAPAPVFAPPEPQTFNPQVARPPAATSPGSPVLFGRAVSEVQFQRGADSDKTQEEFLAALFPDPLGPIDFGEPVAPSSIFAELKEEPYP